MRLSPVVVTHTEAVLREIFQFSSAADKVLSRHFREHKKLGTRERGAIAESIFAILRERILFSDFAESGTGSLMRRQALLGLATVYGQNALPGLSETEITWLNRIFTVDRSLLPERVRANLPIWIWNKLSMQEGIQSSLNFAQASNCPGPLDLRVNTLKASREEVLKALSTAGIDAHATPFSPLGVRLAQKPALQHLSAFNQGWIEVQDEGSQLLAHLLGAKRGEMVADFCAGAGGKTLALGAAMRNTGRLYAFDIAEKRLAKLKPRLARSGLSNVHPVLLAHEADSKLKRLAGKFDRVLVDAPCSGLGTLRRNPDIKWRLTPETLMLLNEKQPSILANAARLVNKNGRLIYATCSILKEENEAVIQNFLAEHSDFFLLPMREVLSQLQIRLEMDDFLKLRPEQHHCDGFFAAVLERKCD